MNLPSNGAVPRLHRILHLRAPHLHSGSLAGTDSSRIRKPDDLNSDYRCTFMQAAPDHSQPMPGKEREHPRLPAMRVISSAQALSNETWDDLLKGSSCTYSRDFCKVVEGSGLASFSDYRYLLFLDHADRPAALACLYSVTTDIAIFAPAKLRTVLATIRRVFPNFLKLRMLECGTPVTLNSPPFVTNDRVPLEEVVAALDALLRRMAKAEGQLVIVVRDFEPNAQEPQQHFKRLGYHCVDSLPNTYLDIRWSSPEDYLSSMKSYYRSKLHRHLKRCEEKHVRYELVEDFAGLAETLCAQWMVVHNQADEFQREVLTPAFYREFSSRMGNRARALLFYRQDELIAHALLLLDGDLLRWLYVGRQQSGNDSLYIYMAHKVVETAIKLGAKRLEMGLTTYSIKQDLGARVTPIRLAIRSASRLINPVVGLVYPLLNHCPHIRNKNIFKEDPRP
jgi:predicted N-acyltransferase